MRFGSLIVGGVCLAVAYFSPDVVNWLHVRLFGWNIVGNGIAWVLMVIGGYLVIVGLFVPAGRK